MLDDVCMFDVWDTKCKRSVCKTNENSAEVFSKEETK